MYSAIVFTVFALLSATAGSGRNTGAATILGNVTDTSGAVVPGAKVTFINTETNFHFEGVTNQEGYYYVPYLRPGIYNVTIDAAGFKRFVRARIELRTNDQPRIGASLEVGPRAESVLVQG